MSEDVVTASVRIHATPDEVFPYLTDPELLPLWLGNRADTSPEPGGHLTINFGDGKVMRGTYILVSPPRRVAFTWGLQGSAELPEGSSTVEISLTADGEDTIVELTHRDLPASERTQHKEGWDMCLAKLEDTAGRVN